MTADTRPTLAEELDRLAASQARPRRQPSPWGTPPSCSRIDALEHSVGQLEALQREAAAERSRSHWYEKNRMERAFAAGLREQDQEIAALKDLLREASAWVPGNTLRELSDGIAAAIAKQAPQRVFVRSDSFEYSGDEREQP